MTEHKGTWWIWKVFWILLIVTALEVFFGLIAANAKYEGTQIIEIFEFQFLGRNLLITISLILTLIKAAYIVMTFMHLGFEKKSLQLTILLPIFILIPYLTFILLNEGGFQHFFK